VQGDSVDYLGPEDSHDPKYHHLAYQHEVASSLKTRAAPENRAYTTVGMDDSMCHYRIVVYPSQALEDVFVNRQPVIFMAIAVSIFTFTSMVFVMYDVLVARRQRILMAKALQSGAIVSSLFPENIQSRLFDEDANAIAPVNKHQLATSQSFEDVDVEPKAKDAISDLFPHCTVLFADIAGFTSWRYNKLVNARRRLQTFLIEPFFVTALDGNPKTFSSSWKLYLVLLTLLLRCEKVGLYIDWHL
jgi:hypothetical protein